jgi:hypothetical protein
MSKTFRDWSLDQALLLLPSVHDFVPVGHLLALCGSAGDGGSGPLRDLGGLQRREGPTALSPCHDGGAFALSDVSLTAAKPKQNAQSEANNVRHHREQWLDIDQIPYAIVNNVIANSETANPLTQPVRDVPRSQF